MSEGISINEAHIDYFSSLKVLVFEPNANSKMAIRGALLALGFKSANVLAINKYHEVSGLISSKKPDIIVALDFDGRNYGLNLVQEHLNSVPERLNSSFFMVSAHNSHVSSSEINEHEVDFILTKPFTHNQFVNKVINLYAARMAPTQELIDLYKLKELYFSGEWESAIALSVKAAALYPTNGEFLYYSALSYKAIGERDEAAKLFIKVIKSSPHHFKSLVALFDYAYENKNYKNAALYAKAIHRRNPINSSRIEQLIKIAISTRDYNEIIKYCSLLKEHNLSEAVEKQLGAGLALGARHLIDIEKNYTLAKTCLQYAYIYAQKYPRIGVKISKCFLDIAEVTIAEAILNKVMIELKFDDLTAKILEVEIYYAKTDYGKSLLCALELLKANNHDYEIYYFAILAGIAIKRKTTFIRELYENGTNRHTELTLLEEDVSNYLKGN